MIEYEPPEPAVKLGLGLKEYVEIAENILIMSQLSQSYRDYERTYSADFLNKRLPPSAIRNIMELRYHMVQDSGVYRIIQVDENEGIDPRKGAFSTGIFSYLTSFYQKHPEKIPS